jgi:hypothetical protein
MTTLTPAPRTLGSRLILAFVLVLLLLADDEEEEEEAFS